MAVFLKRRGPAPVLGKLLSDYAEGDIVKLNESGVPVEFYVAKHDYESGLNGTGRTLLVRKDCYDTRAWHSSNVSAYATSDIDTWLNSDYKALHDSTVQEAIDTTKFYYTPGNGNTTVTTLERSVFMLSVTEFGVAHNKVNTEGTALNIASLLKIAYLNGTAVVQHTRTPYGSAMNSYIANNGNFSYGACTQAVGSRPCFTMPGTAKFDPDTNEFLKA